MRILVWGLGYVGSVTASCIADLGYEVIGVETNPAKVNRLNSGYSPVKEPGLDDLIHKNVAAGRLRAVSDGTALTSSSDVSLICVGTPSGPDGNLMMDYVHKVATDIGMGLRDSNNYHVVALRSTVLPSTARNAVGKILQQQSGREPGRDIGLAVNPEFMRETTAIDDFYSPPFTLIGELDSRSGDTIERLYEGIHSTVYRVSLEEAEILKLCNNAFHALKIGFANEIGRLCDSIGINSRAVMNLVCADPKLNISTAYLKPGFAFGGSCLPKDMRSLVSQARSRGVEIPIIEGILPSNEIQIDAARVKILQTGVKRVGILGLTFKPDTDDLRESPMIELVRDLWRDGIDVLVYDPDVKPEEMLGGNLEYLERQLPQIHRVLRSHLEDVLNESQLLVIGHKRPEFVSGLAKLEGAIPILDLVGIADENGFAKMTSCRGMSW